MSTPLGLIKDLTHEDYSKIPAINRGGLAAVAQSPAHYRWQRDHPDESDTPSQLFGRLVHMAVLEPERWSSEVVVSRKYGRTKAEQEEKAKFEDENLGKTIVPTDLYYTVEAVRKTCSENEHLAEALLQGDTEVTAVWEDRGAGVLCKARFDLITPDHIWDLKTTADANEFCRGAFLYGYHLQAAYYMRGAKACGLLPLAFRFFAVEKTAPFCHKIFQVSPVVLDLANQKLDELLARYKFCLEHDDWPGYSAAIEMLELPAWMASDLPTLLKERNDGNTTTVG